MPYLWTIYFSKALERHIKYIENASLAHFGMRLRDYKRPSQGLHCLLFQFVWMDREEEILSIWCTHDLEEADKLFNWPLLLHHQYHQSIQLFNLQFQRFPILMICLYSFTWWRNPASIWPFYFSFIIWSSICYNIWHSLTNCWRQQQLSRFQRNVWGRYKPFKN